MTRALGVLARRIADALRDLAPIILVIAFFQIAVLQQPFPNLGSILVGLVCVIAGLTLFIQGLEPGSDRGCGRARHADPHHQGRAGGLDMNATRILRVGDIMRTEVYTI